MRIESIDVNKINPAKYNPRKDLKPTDKEYKQIKNSIEKFGYIDPIIWNEKTGTLVGGHQRFKILKEQGEKYIDCVVVSFDEVTEKAANATLNKASGKWEDELLDFVLADLKEQNFDMKPFGFADIEVLAIEDEFDIVLPKNPKTLLGDIYALGEHRLMCGDSTLVDSVEKLMDGDKADFVFTDPPWNVDYGGSDHPSWKKRSILNDKMSTENFNEFLSTSFISMNSVSKPGAMVYVVMSAQEWGNIMDVLSEQGYHWSSTIIWNKDHHVMSRKDYHTKYEPIWYGWKDGAPRLCPLEDRKQSDVWDINRPVKSEEHPTMKPVELVVRAIQNSSLKGSITLDLFGGSGTTLIAAEQTGRKCRMMELDPKYCDVIVNRWEKFTGERAVKLDARD